MTGSTTGSGSSTGIPGSAPAKQDSRELTHGFAEDHGYDARSLCLSAPSRSGAGGGSAACHADTARNLRRRKSTRGANAVGAEVGMGTCRHLEASVGICRTAACAVHSHPRVRGRPAVDRARLVPNATYAAAVTTTQHSAWQGRAGQWRWRGGLTHRGPPRRPPRSPTPPATPPREIAVSVLSEA